MVPEPHTRAVFGAVTAIRELTLKLTSLVSCTALFLAQLILTRAPVVTGPLTIQLNDPVAFALLRTSEAMMFHVTPPSALASIRTDSGVPRLCDQVTAWTDPICHV